MHVEARQGHLTTRQMCTIPSRITIPSRMTIPISILSGIEYTYSYSNTPHQVSAYK